MPDVSVFCEAMRRACEDWSLGYDQSQRWNIYDGGECDCSSLVIWALGQAGFDTGRATYTGNMSSELTARGWKRLPFDIDSLRPGDILLNDAYHTCAVISGTGRGATVAQASIDERGKAAGGSAGDQTGGETNTRLAYVYRYGWDCILRWGEADERAELEVDGKLKVADVSEWQRQCGTVVDGCVSGQLKDCQPSFPSLLAVTFEGTGSALMQEVQTRLGVHNPTGMVFRRTVELLQGRLIEWGYSCIGDAIGTLDEATAKAVQQSLNDGRWRQS